MKRFEKMRSPQAGFSLLEVLVAVGIITAVIGIALNLLNRVQQRNNSEAVKMDMTQQSREAIDQMVRDLHQAGYPNSRLYTGVAPCPTTTVGVACAITGPSGLTTTTTQNSFTMEGDVDGDGQVDVITYALVTPTGGCPCTVQRTQAVKGNAGTAYPMLTRATNFTVTAYDGFGTTPPANLQSIRRIDLRLDVAGPADIQTGKAPTATFTSSVRINN